MKRFQLHRDVDVSGVSGTGIVAEGVVFSNGTVAMVWKLAISSLGVYTSLDDVRHIHGHEGATRIVMVD